MENQEKKVGFFKRKELYIGGIIGIAIGVGIFFLLSCLGIIGFGNKTIVSLKSGKIDQKDLYNQMKKYYQVNYVLEQVDKIILDKMYTLNDDQKKELEEEVANNIMMYNMYYGITEEEFYERSGFTSKEDYMDYLSLDYKKELYYVDYLKENDADKKVEEYYNQNDIFGEISTNHILVEVTDEDSKELALKEAQEIIEKLNNGTSFEKIAEEYEDVIFEEEIDFDYSSANDLVKEYVDAAIKLEPGNYTQEPVLTQFGYHIIYCVNKGDKPTLEYVKDIIQQKLGLTMDNALNELREKNKVEFKDETYKKQYDEYLKELKSSSN